MEHYFIIAVLLVALALFALEFVRADIIAIGVALTLMLTGIVTVNEGFSGFSNPAVITVIAMFILSHGLIRTGVADRVADMIMKVGHNPALLTLAIMIVVGVMSAFMNNIGAVAVLLPSIFVISRKTNYPVTKLLIPLSFGSLLGGLTTLIGTPPNLLVSQALEDQGFRGFAMFDFAPTGILITLIGALYMVFIGRYLLPERKADGGLTEEYKLDGYLTEVIIPAESKFAGVSIRDSSIRAGHGITILKIRRQIDDGLITLAPDPELVLLAGDRLIVEGSVIELLSDKTSSPVKLYAETKFNDESLSTDGMQLAEVAIAPNAPILGSTIKDGFLRRRYRILVLAIRRRGQIQNESFISLPLKVGDVLLVQGTAESLNEMTQSSNFLVVNKITPVERQSGKAPLALAIMALSILTAAFGVLHISVAAMLGVFMMVVTGCVLVKDIYYEVEWRVIFLIACMMPLGIAMDDQHTGTARWMADGIVLFAGDYGPLILLASLLVFTSLITEVMSNAAAAVLVAPIAIAIAVGMGYEPYPFLMGVAIAGSTAFLTPIGHQANVLVYGVGNYKFTDFTKTGFGLNLLVIIATLFIVPLVWPFTALVK